MHSLDRRSIVYAMVGLLFACVTAALIVVSAHPAPTTIVETTVMDHDIVGMTIEPRMLRRRLMSEDAPTMAPSSSPSMEPSIPSSSETVSSGTSTTTIATETVAAAMVGVASSIIVCALVLYASDLRDRFHHEKWATDQHGLQEVAEEESSQKSAHEESKTSAGSTAAESGYWVQVTSNELVEYEGETNILPPLLAEQAREEYALARLPLDDEDGVSISRVSTLTASFMEGAYAADIEERLAIESSSDVTELSDYHRVAHDTALTSLIKDALNDYDGSVCSSLTNGSSTRLAGEECLQGGNETTPESTTPSLEMSPDTPMENDEDSKKDKDTAERNDLAQLEKLIADIPFDELSVGTPAYVHEDRDDTEEVRDQPEDQPEEPNVYVRTVCFVPYATEGSVVSLGLNLYDASSDDSYPTVAKVDLSGPLVGQLFIGDAILAVNDTNTNGLCSDEVMELFQCLDSKGTEGEQVATRMIKLTVMSTESDGGSSSDSQQSVDFGSPGSAIEL